MASEINSNLNINKIIPEYDVEIMKINLNQLNIGEELIIKNKPIDDFYLCKICLNIINYPKMCYECENLFCGQCINNYQTHNKDCPNCRKPFIEMKITRHLKLILNQMVIKCPLNCEKNINYESLESHLKLCKNTPKINKCKLCKTEIINNFQDNTEMMKHNKECSHIPFICGFCKKEMKKKDFDSHIISCPQTLISCDNCKINYPKNLIDTHNQYYCNFLCQLNKLFKEICNKYII